MATLLKDCIERHGWAERLRITVGGLGAGAGRADTTEIGMLARDGFTPFAGACADVGKDQTVLADADCLVVASADDAALFLEWPEAEGKYVLAFTDYVDDSAWAIQSPDSGFRDFVEEVQDATPSLVRALVARPPD
jgi:protein-tyrosine-phosphatase